MTGKSPKELAALWEEDSTQVLFLEAALAERMRRLGPKRKMTKDPFKEVKTLEGQKEKRP